MGGPHEELSKKLVSADLAVSTIRSGARVFLGSGAAEPQTLVRALCEQSDRLHDVEVCSLLTLGAAEHVREEFLHKFRHNAFFVGANVRRAVQEGRADYTPAFLSEIPEILRGIARPDVAMVQLCPPDDRGMCNLGMHVDIQRAAIEAANVVIAEINPSMPRVAGAASIPLPDVTWCVRTQNPLLELPYVGRPNETATEVGMHVARLVEDGACLQVGIGQIPDAVLHHLGNRHHLGIHTEMFSDGLIPLLENGNVDNEKKSVMPGKTITSFAMGSRRLYDYVDRNASIEFHPSDFVNDPRVICRNDDVVAINSAIEIDLTGQVCADSIGCVFYSGIGGQVDFIRGAAMSRRGKPIIALPSTAVGGSESRIVAELRPGAGVVTSRGDVHWVVTEYGAVHLHGKTIRERALSLASIAHPDYRKDLEDYIREKHYSIPEAGEFPSANDTYPSGWSTEEMFGEEAYACRPFRPTDAPTLRSFFYSHSLETIYHRYFTVRREMTPDEAIHLCSVDYRQRMAFGIFNEKGAIVAVGRYDLSPRTARAETAVVVGEDVRQRGMGTFLLKRMIAYAKARGIHGITARIVAGNQGMIRIHDAMGHRIRWDRDSRSYYVTHDFDVESEPSSGDDVAGPDFLDDGLAETRGPLTKN